MTEAILGSLGVSAGDETVYRTLLRCPQATLTDLAAALHWPAARLRRHLRSLERLGLLTRSPTRPVRYAPAAPDVAVEALALRRQEEIERARAAAARLAEQFRLASDKAPPVTIAYGREPNARRDMRTLDMGRPRERPERGISHRAIYDRSALDTGRAYEFAVLGEHGRVLDSLPLELVIVDGTLGLLPGDHLAVHPGALLDGLIALFEALWERATPLWTPGARPPTQDGLTAEDEMLLALSASGLTDEAIARRMGVAQRTVERRMRRVMTLLNAQTRFQAGLRAARLGIIGK